jgi:photosystem II stability/assembly factor-like uncharacterized protein
MMVDDVNENVSKDAQFEEGEDLVYGLAASPDFADSGICFAARRSGLYRSDDGGVTWHSAYDSLGLEAPLPTMAVAMSPGFESDNNVFGGVPGGVTRSVDGGDSWSVSILPSPPPLVSALAVSPDFGQDGVVFASTMDDGVLRSADRGSRWASWNFGLLDLSVFCIAISPEFADDETLFAGVETGVFRSTNGGRAWRETDFPIDFAPVLSLALSPDYAQSGVLFAGTESYGLFRSDDRGRTWQRIGEEAITDAVNGVILSPEFPAKPHVLVALGTALLVSRDGGQSWTDWKDGLDLEQGVASIAAPQGLDADAPLLVGLVGGDVLLV